MSITVREGVRTDAELLEGHVADGAQEQSSHRGRRNAQPRPERFLVGEIDGSPCGTVGWVHDGGSLRIVHVFVEPWARGVGVGDSLMAALLHEAAGCGATAVNGSALPGDRSMKNLFERNGLVAREILVERRLP
ncbi:MAG: GNAT family N-acetyltransferase [Acidimicrobiales bacterium]